MSTSIDLFCGAGGITEGFSQAGFECLYANDFNSAAIETFIHNHPGVWAECRSIEEVDPDEVRSQLGLADGDLDTLVGGPPCQGFSINAPERFLEDPRNSLFKTYMGFVDAFQPKTILFENVPGMVSLGDGAIFRRVIQEFVDRGYSTAARILFAPHYGVPQQRWRLIILGSRAGEITHPFPTHYFAGRTNFRGGRSMVFKLDDSTSEDLLKAVTVGEAIGDLPKLSIGEGSEESAYDAPPHSDFARRMRAGSPAVFNHFAAKLSQKNVERMKHVPPGGSWRDIPHHLLPAGMQRARRSDHTRRYGRLSNEGLAGTVMTKCDPHWGSVFLPDQDRTLTVREAARLQSFPDRYRFLGSRVAQYEQVGNAVPVLLANSIARAIQDHLQGQFPVMNSDAELVAA